MLTVADKATSLDVVTARELLKLMKRNGCVEVRQNKHLLMDCKGCRTTVPVHPGDIAPGTLRNIFKQCEPCLGKDWWRK